MPRRTSSISEEAARFMSSFFRGSTAGIEQLPGRLIPMASMADAMVLAVYMPPQAPGPGQAVHSMPCLSSSVIVPAENFPTASKALTMSTGVPRYSPALMEPP